MKPRLLLLADDDQDSTEAYSMLFRSRGYAVESAADGPAALFKALALRPDLILLDVGLPLMHGLEVLRRLRAGGVPWIPVLVLTGYSSPEVTAAALRDGADDVLTKPCEPRDLCARVEALLRAGGPDEGAPDSGQIRVPRPGYRGRTRTSPADVPAGWPGVPRLRQQLARTAALAHRAQALCGQAALLQARARQIRARVAVPWRYAPPPAA